ncbi:ArsR/SmtB family transcription factor [Paenactinomyces guangxiensis]|uniref:Winged helix-turn-helix transcriptional regulator n=1 Tax=Paenactinomyces guangxiensis TaxID=1490290 RepID=A0A7W2AA93_9BACL|nr:winged helix-turn-helix domain-containing protein [Paenactinomyces guangxiensis]MBA4496565.1 winged helix-turn-helix transcriptional regulator [Paenactinomyces guangxiensis]MBH8593690.1 winged helix-turn-helix transcriptional regulator [Paenactinomyces guangxiensis]
MGGNSNVADVASLLCEPSRANMLQSLLDGRFHTATELAVIAGITPQTASYHLSLMLELKVVTVKKNGRHRYYQLADGQIAQVLESLLCIAPSEKINSLKKFNQNQAIRFARTCYDHLAGKLGVHLTETMVKMGILHPSGADFALTEEGKIFLTNFGIDVLRAQKKRRSFARCCLDWSERRYHLAGSLGHALLEKLFALSWIEQLPESRAVKVTETGAEGFKNVFAIQ